MTTKSLIRATALGVLLVAVSASALSAQQRPVPTPAAAAPAQAAEPQGAPEGAGIETGNLIGTVPFTAQEQLLLRPDDKAAIRKLEDKHVKELRDLEDKYAGDLRALRTKQADEREVLRKTVRR